VLTVSRRGVRDGAYARQAAAALRVHALRLVPALVALLPADATGCRAARAQLHVCAAMAAVAAVAARDDDGLSTEVRSSVVDEMRWAPQATHFSGRKRSQ
jgi:hypothetical protein